jgi:hypothetical protein
MLSHDQTIWIQAMINRATEIINIVNSNNVSRISNNQQSSNQTTSLQNRIGASRSLIEGSRNNNSGPTQTQSQTRYNDLSANTATTQIATTETPQTNISQEFTKAHTKANQGNEKIKELTEKVEKLSRNNTKNNINEVSKKAFANCPNQNANQKSLKLETNENLNEARKIVSNIKKPSETMNQIFDFETQINDTKTQKDFWSERANKWQKEKEFTQNGSGYAEKDKNLVERTYKDLIELQNNFEANSGQSGKSIGSRSDIISKIKTNQAILDLLKQGKSSESIDRNAIAEASYSHLKSQLFKNQISELGKNIKQWDSDSKSKNNKKASLANQQININKELLEKSRTGNNLYSILEKFYDAESTRSYSAEQKRNLDPIREEIKSLSEQFNREVEENDNSKYKISYDKIINSVNRINNYFNLVS